MEFVVEIQAAALQGIEDHFHGHQFCQRGRWNQLVLILGKQDGAGLRFDHVGLFGLGLEYLSKNAARESHRDGHNKGCKNYARSVRHRSVFPFRNNSPQARVEPAKANWKQFSLLKCRVG